MIKEQNHQFVVVSEKATLLTIGTKLEKCLKCNCRKVVQDTVESLDPITLDMPVIYISDYEEDSVPLTKLQKSDGEILVKYQYISNDDSVESFECFCAIKVQGASSAYYPKKNFTVKFYKDAEMDSKLKVDFGWGKENKYCMKANYIDFSQARNIVGAKLFTQLVQSREYINSGLSLAPNYGVIDGYPVLVYINGNFHGIYTMNIPKDEWMFAMEGEEDSKEAILMADAWSDSVSLYEKIGEDYSSFGWELEYCSTEDDTWVRESFNRLITLLNCGNKRVIKNELKNHLDIEAAIDNMLYTYFLSAADNTAKNILWATYDGEIWIPSMYDMDGTFGIFWNGEPVESRTYPSIVEQGSFNIPGMKLYTILIECFADEVEERWIELRQSILTIENTTKVFNEFFAKIPDVAYESDALKWEGIPYIDVNRTNMYEATVEQLARLDEFFYSFNKTNLK